MKFTKIKINENFKFLDDRGFVFIFSFIFYNNLSEFFLISGNVFQKKIYSMFKFRFH